MSSLLTESSGDIYVAQMLIPTVIVDPPTARVPIQHPERLGIHKGYFHFVERPGNETTIPGAAGVVVVIELLASSLRAAEDDSLVVGERISSALSGFLGTPYQDTLLQRVAKIDPMRRLLAQHHYIQMPEPFVMSRKSGDLPQQMGTYLQLITSLGESARDYLQAAVHWYGLALSTSDAAVSYVSAWVGLEHLGSLLSQHWHPYGTKASCRTCGNTLGRGRDRGKAGIRHAFGLAAQKKLWDMAGMDDVLATLLQSEVDSAFTFDEAETLRNRLVHGLKEEGGTPSDYLAQARLFRRHIIHVLHYCIRTILGEESRSLIPADHRSMPDHRYSLQFKSPLPRDPFSGQWFNEPRVTYSFRRIAPNDNLVAEFEYAQFASVADAHSIGFEAGQTFSRGNEVYDLTADPQNHVPLGPFPSWEGRGDEPDWRPSIPFDERQPHP